MTEYLDRYPTMHEYAEGKRINPKLIDLISRADAIKAVASITMSIHLSDVICDKLLALPSADAVMRDATAEERTSVQRYIDSISTEAVQVVRCKDCRHAYFKDFDKYCPYMVGALKPDGYCHHGERREP